MNQSVLSTLLGAGALSLGMLQAAPALAITTLTVTPSMTNASPGDSFNVEVAISGLTSESGVNDIVRSYDLLLGYDSSRLTANSVMFGDLLGTGVEVQNFSDPALLLSTLNYVGANPPNMAVEFKQLSNLCGFASEAPADCPSPLNLGPFLDTLQPDAFVLVTINFTLASDAPVGLTGLTLLADGAGMIVPAQDFDMKGNSRTTPLVLTLESGQVQVPEPGTLALLLAVGMAGGARRAVRRRKGAAQGIA